MSFIREAALQCFEEVGHKIWQLVGSEKVFYAQTIATFRPEDARVEVIYEMHHKKAPQPTAEGSCSSKKTSASVQESTMCLKKQPLKYFCAPRRLQYIFLNKSL